MFEVRTVRRKMFAVVGACISSVGLLVVVSGNTQTISVDLLGKSAPTFELESVSGETVRSEDLKGKVVLMDFWAVWCGPCKKSMPFFQQLSEKYRVSGLEVIGLHVDDRMPPLEKVGEYLEQAGVHYTNVASTVEVDDDFMIFAMPTTYLIDRDGVVVKQHIGFNPNTAPLVIEDAVRELLEVN